MRNQLSEQANNLANTASEGYRRASETAGDLANKGRNMYDKARGAVSKGAEEAQRYVRDVKSDLSDMSSDRVGTGSAYGSGSSSSGSFSSGSSGGGHSDGSR